MCVGVISNFISFDSNTAISCNASCSSHFKLVVNLDILLSSSNEWSSNLSLLFSTSSFNLPISFIFSFADNFYSFSYSKLHGFSQNLYLSSTVV